MLETNETKCISCVVIRASNAPHASQSGFNVGCILREGLEQSLGLDGHQVYFFTQKHQRNWDSQGIVLERLHCCTPLIDLQHLESV
jgi:hypothetical protein